MKTKKLFKSLLATTLTFSMVLGLTDYAHAEEPETTEEETEEVVLVDEGETAEVTLSDEVVVELQNVVAHTVVGYNDREIYSFDLTFNSEEAAKAYAASDLDITGNGPSCYGDPATGGSLTGYADDEIETVVNGKVVTLTAKQFSISGCGMPAIAWEVKSSTGVNFKLGDVDEVTTKTLDEMTYGEYTYAGITRKYALYVPADATGPVPLVIWNHGGGEYGTNDIVSTLTKNRGVTCWPEEGYECAVLMIQVSNANYSYRAATNESKKSLIDQNNALQAAIVRDLIADGTVDPYRVYVTGASSGGGATMRFVMQFPEMVAGAIAMCSMDPIVNIHSSSGVRTPDMAALTAQLVDAFQGDVYTWDEEAGAMVKKAIDTEALVNTPIYFTHAENDTTCQVRSSQLYYAALEELGATQNKISIFSNAEMDEAGISSAFYGGGLLHWSWCKVHNDCAKEGSAGQWLFEQEIPHIVDITAFAAVGYNDKEINAFEITFNNAEVAKAFAESKIDITGNGPSSYGDPATGASLTGYADDEIEVSVDGNVVTLSCKPMAINGCGMPAIAWEVTSDAGFSFKLGDVDKVVTKTLDDIEIGEYTACGLTRKYALYVPEGATGPVPLVIWNHGGGEYGPQMDIETNLTKNRGVTCWNEEGYECAVLMIQVSNPNYSYGAARDEAKKALIDQNNALQAAFVKELIADGIVDENRVYVTGASSGGGATMRFVMQNPEMVAGAIAMCSMDPIVPIHTQSGVTDQSLETLVPLLEEAFQGEVYVWDEASGQMVLTDINTQALVETPIYFTHAENDPTCQKVSSEAYYQALENLGATQNKITIFSNEEMDEAGVSSKFFGGALLHWSWCKVHNDCAKEGSAGQWLFQQTNYKAPVEEEPTPDTPVEEKPTVNTGDMAPIALMSTVMLASAAAYVELKRRTK